MTLQEWFDLGRTQGQAGEPYLPPKPGESADWYRAGYTSGKQRASWATGGRKSPGFKR